MSDLFGYKERIPRRLPRLPRIDGCAADRETEAARIEFRNRLNLVESIEKIRAPILARRDLVRQCQQAINRQRKTLATIKGQSRAAKAAREPYKAELQKLYAEREKLKREAIQ